MITPPVIIAVRMRRARAARSLFFRQARAAVYTQRIILTRAHSFIKIRGSALLQGRACIYEAAEDVSSTTST